MDNWPCGSRERPSDPACPLNQLSRVGHGLNAKRAPIPKGFRTTQATCRQVDHEKQEIVVRTSNKKYFKRTIRPFSKRSVVFHWPASRSTAQMPVFATKHRQTHNWFQLGLDGFRIQVPDLARFALKLQENESFSIFAAAGFATYFLGSFPAMPVP